MRAGQNGAWCLAARRCGIKKKKKIKGEEKKEKKEKGKKNVGASRSRSLAVDFQGGFCASDFCERPQSSQRQPCGNSSGRSKPQPPQTQFSDGHRMSNMEGEDEVLSKEL